jgi:hypothetical protein
VVSQNLDDAERILENVEVSTQIDSLKAAYPEWQFFEQSYTDTVLLSKNFYQKNNILTESATHYIAQKLLEKDSVLEFRVQYIYLNGAKRSKIKTDSIRQLILDKFTENVPFSELAKKYSDDPSASKGGDLGWFPAGRMVSSFENAIRKHEKGDVFLSEHITPSRKWYFVILKTHKDRITSIRKSILMQINKQ